MICCAILLGKHGHRQVYVQDVLQRYASAILMQSLLCCLQKCIQLSTVFQLCLVRCPALCAQQGKSGSAGVVLHALLSRAAKAGQSHLCIMQTQWDSSYDSDAEGPAAKALRSLEQQVLGLVLAL